MNNLQHQQWKPQNDPHTSLTGVQISLRLVQHLVGISTSEEEINNARDIVSSAKIGETVMDRYGYSYVRIK